MKNAKKKKNQAEITTVMPLIEENISVDELIASLSEETLEIGAFKEALVNLAGHEDVAAFRALENLEKNAEGERKIWFKLALSESRMLLESRFLDKKQVFISTGLGGKNNKLRFSVAFKHKEQIFLPYQEQVLRNEILFLMADEEGELEDLVFEEEFAIAKVLLPIKSNLHEVFKTVIERANQFGNFLNAHIAVTNVRNFTPDSLRKLAEKQTEHAASGEAEAEIASDEIPEEISNELRRVLGPLIEDFLEKMKRLEQENHSDDDDEAEDVTSEDETIE